MVTGLLLLTFAYLWYTRLPTDGDFLTHLLVPYVASGFGLAFVFIPLSLAALSVVEDRIAGVSSGLLNASQQIGGALGVALISTVSRSHTKSLLQDRVLRLDAMTEGFNWAFWVAVSCTAVGVVVAVALLRSRDVPTHAIAEAPGAAG
jgi:sugar phosphate permease